MENMLYEFSGRYCTMVTLIDTHVPPISGTSVSLFCNVTVFGNDDTAADLNYIWFRDDIRILREDKYSGLGSDQITITVSTPV